MTTLPIHTNPVDPFLRTDRIPHIWCPGCGIGTSVNCLQPRADRRQDRPQEPGHRLRHRLHRPRRRLREPGFLPHHARPRDSLRHRPEAGESQAERRGLLRRRRPVRHRRQSPDPRRPPQRRSQGHLHQQPDLRHDRRPDGARPRRDQSSLPPIPTAPTIRRSTCPTWWRPPAPSTSPAGPPSTFARWPAPCRRCSPRRASASSKSSRPARRSTSAATRWATASTP